MKRSVARFLRWRADETGAALVMVVVMGAVMMMVVTTAVAISVSGLRSAKTSEDWNAALAAAYAGVEEYQNRLANDSTYTKYGNPASTYSIATGSTVALDPNNPAFGAGTAGSWGSVPGSAGKATFRYEIDNSRYTSNGVLTVRSTGRVGAETRTVVADLKQSGFIDFLYFTDYEIQDPTQGGAACTVSYSWVTANSCTKIQFGSSDVMNGPMHSNDTLRLCGRFKGKVTTGKTGSPNYESACTTPVFDAGKPVTGQLVGMPETNAEMKREVRTDIDEVTRPGCLYTGPTSIVLKSDGTMTVKSPFTKFTNIKGEGSTSGTNPSECGTPGVTGLGSPTGQSISILEENLIYVQNVPSVATDKNAWAPGTYPTNFTCTNADTGGWRFGTGADILRYPMAGENFVPTTSPVHYGCRNGDVYVNGSMKGAMTIAAENYVYVVNDILYPDAGADILGLVGNNAVWVWNPMAKSTSSSWPYSTIYTPLLEKNREINAAILSVAHTFLVQNHGIGPTSGRGVLKVNGAIAQKFRGPVGTSSGHGYDKSYNYDKRLTFTAPPKFLSPTSTTYGVSQIGAVGTAFKADGSAG